MKSNLLFVILLVFASSHAYQGIGDRLIHSFLQYISVPLNTTDAENNGWSAVTGTCDPHLGIAYTNPNSLDDPIILRFTPGGQIAGMSILHFRQPAEGLQNFWVPQSNDTFMLSVSFRSSEQICSGQIFEETLGTQVVINQDGVNFPVPLSASEADSAEWTKGGCIGKMGTHWSYDLSTHPSMSWNVSNLLPVVVMFNQQTEDISAIFFTTNTVQYEWPFGPWEGPLISSLMCYNWCSAECNWGYNLFPTFHWFFTDYTLNTCDAHCDSEVIIN